MGPTYIPENRYDSEGWFCQNVTMLRSRSGRRKKRTIGNRRSTDHDMAAAAGRDVAAVVVKLFSGQPIPARLLEHAAC